MRLRFDLGCHFSFVQIHNIFCSLISVLISGQFPELVYVFQF